MEGRLGCDIDYLNAYKINLLVRIELALIRLNLCSLSRRIDFTDRARIIEFGFKKKLGGITISCGCFRNPKSESYLPKCRI
jgi:hypothetical protein